MSAPLEKAKEHVAAERYRAACDSLYGAVSIASVAGDVAEGQAILDLVTTMSGESDRRVQQECDEIARITCEFLDREAAAALAASIPRVTVRIHPTMDAYYDVFLDGHIARSASNQGRQG